MLNEYDHQYRQTLIRLLEEGVTMPCRSDGVRVNKIFDVNISAEVGFVSPSEVKRAYPDIHIEPGHVYLPALTLRKVFPRTAWYELLWMLRGSTDVTELQEKGIKIWNGNSTREYLDSVGLHHVRENHVPNAYGKQFRRFNGHHDQLLEVYRGLFGNPYGRRHMISLWNPTELKDTPLPPCHVLYQFVPVGDMLNLKFYQRSSDFLLAGSQNFMFATMFLHLMAQLTGFQPGRVAHSIGDCHLYLLEGHVEVARELVQMTEGNPEPIYTPDISCLLEKPGYDLDNILYDLFFEPELEWDTRFAPALGYKYNTVISPKRLPMVV